MTSETEFERRQIYNRRSLTPLQSLPRPARRTPGKPAYRPDARCR